MEVTERGGKGTMTVHFHTKGDFKRMIDVTDRLLQDLVKLISALIDWWFSRRACKKAAGRFLCFVFRYFGRRLSEPQIQLSPWAGLRIRALAWAFREPDDAFGFNWFVLQVGNSVFDRAHFHQIASVVAAAALVTGQQHVWQVGEWAGRRALADRRRGRPRQGARLSSRQEGRLRR